MEITWKHLAISNVNYIHVDNNKSSGNYMTYCGKNDTQICTRYLTPDKKYNKIKVCKKCSHIYRRKYGHSLEGFLAGLKVRDKLFINVI